MLIPKKLLLGTKIEDSLYEVFDVIEFYIENEISRNWLYCIDKEHVFIKYDRTQDLDFSLFIERSSSFLNDLNNTDLDERPHWFLVNNNKAYGIVTTAKDSEYYDLYNSAFSSECIVIPLYPGKNAGFGSIWDGSNFTNPAK